MTAVDSLVNHPEMSFLMPLALPVCKNRFIGSPSLRFLRRLENSAQPAAPPHSLTVQREELRRHLFWAIRRPVRRNIFDAGNLRRFLLVSVQPPKLFHTFLDSICVDRTQSDSLPEIMSCNSHRCRKIKATLFLELPHNSLDYLEPAQTDKITCCVSNETGVDEILNRVFEWQLFS
jgi:hypothetical protein